MSDGSFSLSLSSSGNVGANIRALGDIFRGAVRQSLVEVAEQLLLDSRPFVPILTGDLVRSGRVEVLPSVGGAGAEQVRVVYGNAVLAYAETQHEDPYNHPSLGFFGAAKYLERPFKLNEMFYLELLQLLIRRNLENAGLG